jgi:hypothetical protein
MPLLIEQMLLGVVLPAAVALAVFVLARTWRRDSLGRIGTVLAIGGGYLAGHLALRGWPPFPPAESTQWLVFLVLLVTFLGAVDVTSRVPDWVRWAVRAAVSLAVPCLLLQPLVDHAWSPAVAMQWISLTALAIFASWSFLDWLASRTHGATLPLVLLIVSVGTSLVLLFSGSASLGQLAGVLAATMGVSLLLAFLRPGFSLGHGAVPVAMVLLAGLWINGKFYAEVPTASAAMLILAPAAIWGVQAAVSKSSRPWQEVAIRSVAVSIPVLLAVALALQAQPALTY